VRNVVQLVSSPIQESLKAWAALDRFTASAKRTGKPSCAPAMRGWTVFQMHAARGGEIPGKLHPNFKHVECSTAVLSLRKTVSVFGGESRKQPMRCMRPLSKAPKQRDDNLANLHTTSSKVFNQNENLC
jgi:hypothetical protein